MLNEIYSNLTLREGISRLREFFVIVYLREGISVKELSLRLRLPVPVVSAIKNECKKQGAVSAANGVRLTEAGVRYVQEELRYKTLNTEKIKAVLDAPHIEELAQQSFAAEIHALEGLYQQRPPVDVTVDQSLCTAETGIKRALMLLRTGGLIGKRILFAGDDDLTSVAVLLTLKALCIASGDSPPGPCPVAVTVMDIDERVLRYIEAVTASMQSGWQVECVNHDFRQPIPAAHAGVFDAVFTDPPYTLPGLTLFVSRGVEALKPESDLYFYVSCAHKDPAARLAAQRMYVNAGLVIEGLHGRFNAYHGAQILGGVSDLTVLSTTGETCPPCTGVYDGVLYTNETNRSLRLYVCKDCRAQYKVGFGQAIPTVESLKAASCASCGGSTFLLKERQLY